MVGTLAMLEVLAADDTVYGVCCSCCSEQVEFSGFSINKDFFVFAFSAFVCPVVMNNKLSFLLMCYAKHLCCVRYIFLYIDLLLIKLYISFQPTLNLVLFSSCEFVSSSLLIPGSVWSCGGVFFFFWYCSWQSSSLPLYLNAPHNVVIFVTDSLMCSVFHGVLQWCVVAAKTMVGVIFPGGDGSNFP